MRSNKAPGFTFMEAMISIVIVGIISVAAYYNLRSARMTDELRTAARVVAADLRAAQAQALQGQNVKWCTDVSGKDIVCQDGTASCSDPAQCIAKPSGAFGVHFYKDTSSYELFSILSNDQATWGGVNPGQVYSSRYLAKSGAPNTTITDLVPLTGSLWFNQAAAIFERQNGRMHVLTCYTCDLGLVGPLMPTFKITIKHTISLKTISVSLNTLTGRISIEE